MTTQAIQTVPRGNEVEYTPFGAEDKIKISVQIVQKYIAIPTKSGKLPSDTDCIRFMMLCRSRRLNPFEGDCFLQGYDGRNGPEFSLITAHQAFLKRAEKNPEFDGFESGVIVREGEDGPIIDREGDFTVPGDILLGGWATVHFKNRKHPMKRRLALGTFRKPYGRWNDDPAGMIVKCAEADALRSSFPTLLGGWISDNEKPLIDISTVQPKVPELGYVPEPAKSAAQPAPEPAKAPEPSGGSGDTTQPEKTQPAPAGEAPQGNSGQPGTIAEGQGLSTVRKLMAEAGVTEQ